MMQDSEVIKLVKPVPSDRLATQVLVAWYHATSTWVARRSEGTGLTSLMTSESCIMAAG